MNLQFSFGFGRGHSRLLLLLILLLMLCPMARSFAILVTFDDFLDTHNGGGTLITNKYQNLVWSNFAIGNAIIHTANNGPDGYFYGMLTVSNIITGAHGDPAEIDADGTNFNFFSAYLTGAWRSNLNVEVQGFRSGSLVYDTIVLASATSPTLFSFNYLNVDRLYFSSSGGQYAGFSSDGLNFAMDNLTYEFVPEPSSLLLTAVGALSLCPLFRRKRTSPHMPS